VRFPLDSNRSELQRKTALVTGSGWVVSPAQISCATVTSEACVVFNILFASPCILRVGQTLCDIRACGSRQPRRMGEASRGDSRSKVRARQRFRAAAYRCPPIRDRIVTRQAPVELVNYRAHILVRVSVSCPDYRPPGWNSARNQSPGPKVIPPESENEPMPLCGPSRSADPATKPLPVAPAKRPVPPVIV
jgi:hypothetical protein